MFAHLQGRFWFKKTKASKWQKNTKRLRERERERERWGGRKRQRDKDSLEGKTDNNRGREAKKEIKRE